ncbi:MAG: sugar transferase [Pseudonocardiaceae bacterium]
MLELDLAYVRSWSFWTDLMILLRTVPTLLRGHGAR